MKYFLSIVFTMIFFLWWNVFANYLELDTYSRLKSVFNSSPDIEKIDIEKLDSLLKWKNCYYYENWDYFIYLPICFLNKNISQYFSLEETVDILHDDIIWFSDIYDNYNTKFSYYTSTPIFYSKPLDYYINDKDSVFLKIITALNYKLKIHKKHFALNNISDYSFYVSDKNLDNRWQCSLKNYNIAIKSLDKLLLKPNQAFNFNDTLVGLKWYCWESSEKYLFYAWVCWASTQLFRVSLINPYIYINKRYSHAQRYVNYYDEYIYWDDASVYEYIKQFEITNRWKYPMYFRFKNINSTNYLYSVVPIKESYRTDVTKEQTRSLSSYVSKEVFNFESNELIYKQDRASNYLKKNYEFN